MPRLVRSRNRTAPGFEENPDRPIVSRDLKDRQGCWLDGVDLAGCELGCCLAEGCFFFGIALVLLTIFGVGALTLARL